MKKNILLFFILTFFMPYGYAQPDSIIKKNIFKLSPFHLIDNTIFIGLERSRILKYNAFQLSLGVTGYENSGTSLWGIQVEPQYKIYLNEPRILGKRQSGNLIFHGIYFSPYITFKSFSMKNSLEYQFERCFVDSSVYYTSYCADSGRVDYFRTIYTDTIINIHKSLMDFGGGFIIGAQFVFFKVLYVEVFLGGGIKYSINRKTGEPSDTYYRRYYGNGYTRGYPDNENSGVYPKIGFMIGVGL